LLFFPLILTQIGEVVRTWKGGEEEGNLESHEKREKEEERLLPSFYEATSVSPPEKRKGAERKRLLIISWLGSK